MAAGDGVERRLRVVYLTRERGAYGLAGLRAILAAGHSVPLVIATRAHVPWVKPRVPPVDWPLHGLIVAARTTLRAAQKLLRSAGDDPVHALCEQAGVPLTLTESPRAAEHLAAIREAEPDVILSSDWLYHIPQSVCRLARVEALNGHPSCLPEYHGANTTFAALIDGATSTGFTVHVITPQFDAGPIVAQRRVPIGRLDSALSVHRKRLAVVGQVVCRALQLAGQRDRYRPNPPGPSYPRCATATYLRRRTTNLVRAALGLPRIPFPARRATGGPGG